MQTIDIRSDSFKAQPHQVLAAALERGPMAETRIPFVGKVKIALTHEAVQAVLKGTDKFAVDGRNAGHKHSFGMWLPKSLRLVAQNLLSLDDPDHIRQRRLADKPFRRAAIESLRPQVAARIDTLIEQIDESQDVDLARVLFQILPVQVIGDMLGIAPNAQQRLMKIMSGFSSASNTFGILRALTGLGSVIRQLRFEIDIASKNPRPGLLSELIQASQDGEIISEDELVALVLVLFVAGHDTTTNLLSSGLHALLTTPDSWKTACQLDSDGWAIAIDELMRYTMPVFITRPRFVIQDMDFYGVKLERGEEVMALIGAANMDPAIFNAPLTLNLARRPNRHAGWGGGPHICLGLHLAKMEVELVFSRLAERWPKMALLNGQESWTKRLGVRGLETLPVRLNA